jgi:hypothetical protein
MARVRAVADVGAISIASSTTKTLIGLQAPTNQAVALKRFILSCQGVAAADPPLLVEVGTVTGGTSSGLTERQIAGPSVTLQAAALSYSAEPTWTPFYSWYVHLQSGYESVFQNAEDEWVFAAGIWALRVTSGVLAASTNVRASVVWEE